MLGRDKDAQEGLGGLGQPRTVAGDEGAPEV